MNNNISNRVPPQTQRVDFNSCDEFSNLTSGHKAAVVIVSLITGILTCGLALPFLIPALIGKFRELELDETTPQAMEASKVNDMVKRTFLNGSVKTSEKTSDAKFEIDLDGDIPLEDLTLSIDEVLKEKLISSFWMDYETVEKLIDALTLVRVNSTGVQIKVYPEAHKILQQYLEYKKQSEADKVFTPEDQTIIVDQIEIILKKKEDPIHFPFKISETQQVITHKTVGDGACGFHALLGIVDNNVYRCDAVDARKKFCQFLQRCFDRKLPNSTDNQLPDSIKTVLDDYFLHPEGIPEELKKAFIVTVGQGKNKREINLLKKYTDGYRELPSIAEKEARKQAFRNDKRIFRIYLNYIGRNSTYLLQDELEAVAQSFNKRIRLFQGGWGTNDQTNLGEATLNPTGAEEVIIYYTGQRTKHFERAEVQPIPRA